MEPPGATILGVAAPLDQPRFLKPVDDPAQGDRFDVEMIGKLDLPQTRLATKPRKRPPLRAGYAQRRSTTIEIAAQSVRRLGNLKWKIFKAHDSSYNKRTY